MSLGAHDVETTELLDPLPQHDVGAASGHVGGDGDRPLLSCGCHHLSLPLVLFGVEDLVHDPPFLQKPGETLTLLDAHRADEHRLTLAAPLLDLIGDGLELDLLRAEDQVGFVDPHHGPVGGDRHHLEPVDLVELLRLGDGGPGHPGQHLEGAKVILKGDRGERSLLLLDLDALLGLDRLVQAVRPPPSGHGAPGEFVNDHHFAVTHDVLTILQVQRVSA